MTTEARRQRRRVPPGVAVAAALVVFACIGAIGMGAVLLRLGQRLPDVVPTQVLGLLPRAGTPTPTVPPTLTPSPTPPPSPTPTPTPVPPARIAAGDAALFAGDWARAAAQYQAVLDQSSDPALRAAARLGLARARLAEGDAAGALADLDTFLADNPESPNAPDAHFLRGEALMASAQWEPAIAAYNDYLAVRPGPLDSYVYEAIANAQVNLGDYAGAVPAFEAAIAAPRQGNPWDLRERLASSLAAAGNLEGALAEYDALYAVTDQNFRKARLAVAAGDLLYGAGRLEEAYDQYLLAVNNFPTAAASFQALLVLVNDGVPVDELQRGLTNYYAENYEPALAALERYRAAHAAGAASTTPEGDAEALYHLGLTYAALDQPAQAIAAWRELVETYPGDAYWTDAYFQIAFIQPYPDDVDTFQAFAAAAPSAPEAPDALFRAARLCERNDDFECAGELWTQIATDFPQAPQAAGAAVEAGLVLYRSGDYASAIQRFELATTLGSDSAEHARAWLWIGKAREQEGDRAGARQAWQQAARFGPNGYYPLRAAQLLSGESPFAPPAGYSFQFDQTRELQQMDQWLRETFPNATGLENPSQLQPGVWREARFVRGAELWRLGRLREAHAEFDSLRLALAGDPLASWQLALYFNQIGAYDLGIRAARNVVDLAGLEDSLDAPRYILLLRYPAPFADYVVDAAQDYAVHPFVMYAKMRIESFFWKYAYSVADARGLNQFIPVTADEVAARLAIPNFTYEDLFRPAVSIPMGAFYLDYIHQNTGGGPEAMLAGYYAGPGNAQVWLEIAEGDYDLFVEVIRLPDAKGYVQTTFEYFEEYRVLYGRE